MTGILLVDDSPDDRMAIVRALDKAGCTWAIEECPDGDSALESLRGRPPGVLPRLVLLDLNMPRLDGAAVLERLKRNPDTQSIPVVILTTSCAPSDIARCYQAGANSYVQKPVRSEGLTLTVARIVDFWIHSAVPPPRDRSRNTDRPEHE